MAIVCHWEDMKLMSKTSSKNIFPSPQTFAHQYKRGMLWINLLAFSFTKIKRKSSTVWIRKQNLNWRFFIVIIRYKKSCKSNCYHNFGEFAVEFHSINFLKFFLIICEKGKYDKSITLFRVVECKRQYIVDISNIFFFFTGIISKTENRFWS